MDSDTGFKCGHTKATAVMRVYVSQDVMKNIFGGSEEPLSQHTP